MPGDELTWAKFTEYMDEFKKNLSETYPSREACKLRHEVIDKRLKTGDDNFLTVDGRLKVIERNMFIALGALGVLQLAIRAGWLDGFFG